MHLFTQSPLGADGKAITDNEHPDHQLRIDRGTANVTVERLQLPPHLTQIEEPTPRKSQGNGITATAGEQARLNQQNLPETDIPHSSTISEKGKTFAR